MARKANVLDFLMGPSRQMAKAKGIKETKAMINKQRAQKAASAIRASDAKGAVVKKGAEGPKRSVAKAKNPQPVNYKKIPAGSTETFLYQSGVKRTSTSKGTAKSPTYRAMAKTRSNTNVNASARSNAAANRKTAAAKRSAVAKKMGSSKMKYGKR